jgi:hypothetical protein
MNPTQKPAEIMIVDWEYSRWLTGSSFLFMIPSIYSYSCKLYGLSILLLFTSLISANYWRKATYSIRRNLDLIFAKISFFVFLYNGVMYIRDIPYIIIFVPGTVCLIYTYHRSNTLFLQYNNQWLNYHILFHGLLMIGQMIIVDSKYHKTLH